MPSGLYLVGSTSSPGAAEPRVNLMTANWVMQVATDPKTVAVSLDVTSRTRALVEESKVLALSVLHREDRAVVRHFVRPAEAFTFDAQGAPSSVGDEAVFGAPSGAPVLARALAWLDCRVVEQVGLTSHTLFVATVTDAGMTEDTSGEVLRVEDTRMHYGG
jgi:flavin reductase (DIM6/NTAB) family NADH-FMN oxidoreductase RutF